jgi:hypothetical protein
MAATMIALLHFDGMNGSTSFVDEFGSHTWTNVDDTSVIDTSQAKFGPSSARTGAGGAGGITTPDAPEFRFAGDFTADAQVRFAAVDTGAADAFIAAKKHAPGGFYSWGFGVNFNGVGDNFLIFQGMSGGTPITLVQPWTLSVDTWYHLEFVVSSGQVYFFVDGVQQGSARAAAGSFDYDTGVVICDFDGDNAWIDELRIADGADHTSNFTPPTEPYTLPITGSGAFTLPTPTVLGANTPGPVGTGAFTLPSATVAAEGTGNYPGGGEWYLPSLRLDGTGVTGFAGTGIPMLPLFTLSAQGDVPVAMVLPSLQLAATGVIGATGTAALRLPALTLLGTAQFQPAGDAAPVLPALQAQAQGLVGTVGSAQFALPLLTLSAEGTRGAAGAAIFTLPLVSLDARAISSVAGAGVFLLPIFQLDAQGSLAVEALYRTWALNLRNKALTEYDGFEFNSFALVDGKLLAASDAGLFILDGSDADIATDIDALARTGIVDMGTSYLKRVPRVYYSGLLTDNMLYSAITREQGKHTYRLLQQGRPGLQQRPLPFGRRLKSRYWQFEFQNENGGDLSVHSLVIQDAVVRRRVQ